MNDPSPVSVISRSRLEFLFDGVFAIAMTILVLELHVPDLVERHSVSELSHALIEHAATFGSYIFSFWVLGVLWFRHNHHFHHVRFITRTMLFLTLLQLAAAAFFPFCAALFGRYPFNPVSGLVYTGCVATYGWSSFANWQVGIRSGSSEEPTTVPAYRRTWRKQLRVCVLITCLFGFYLMRTLTG